MQKMIKAHFKGKPHCDITVMYSSYIESVIDGSQIDHTIKSDSDHDSLDDNQLDSLKDSQSNENDFNDNNNNQSSINEPTPKLSILSKSGTEFPTTNIKMEDVNQNQEINKRFDEMQGQIDRMEAKMEEKMDNLTNMVAKLVNTQQSPLTP